MDIKNNHYGRVSEYAERFGLRSMWLARSRGVFRLTLRCLALPKMKSMAMTRANLSRTASSASLKVPTCLQILMLSRSFLTPKFCINWLKAANAGGVATSGLEMTQNAQRLPWGRDEVDMRLRMIMTDIHANCVKYGEKDGFVNYVNGANIAGFVKVSDAMTQQGIY